MRTATLAATTEQHSLSCDGAQLLLELRGLAAMVPAAAFRLGELAAQLRVDDAALSQLEAYLRFLLAVPTERCDGFRVAVTECLRLMRNAYDV